MPSGKVRIRYWMVDAKQLTFWLTAAFVAGAGPNLIGAIHPVALLIVSIAAALVAARFWLRNEVKNGIGVYVHLPKRGGDPTSDDLLKFVSKKMKKEHRDWFRSGPDSWRNSPRERAEWTIKTIEHRLKEADILTDDVPVFLYLHCYLEEAFHLGRVVSRNWTTIPGLPTFSADDSSQPRIAVDFRVRSVSNYGGKSRKIYGIDLAGIERAGVDSNTVKTEIVTDLPDLYSRPTVDAQRLALIVFAGEQTEFEAFGKFRTAALEAASGHASNGYLTGESDACDNAIIISVLSADFIGDLEALQAEKYVRQIFRAWRDGVGRIYGRVDVPVRLFMKVPSVIVFAIGAIAPDGSSLVDYNKDIARVAKLGCKEKEGVVAIIDGDDVGNRMERDLLAGDLNSAIEYSRHVDQALAEVARQARLIPGVKDISAGGDSVIFRFPSSALQGFTATLERLRGELGFPFSCGYGSDSRAAFVALRVAKSSGKNRTEGQLSKGELGLGFGVYD